MSIDQALFLLANFQGTSLTESLSAIERQIIGHNIRDVERLCEARGIDDGFIESALGVKRVAGQINVIIHAAGILRSLSGILEPGEKVESVSLGAGNTGKRFDLETNLRVAEYKFIDWQGGPEVIRQNATFKDFFELAEYETTKRKYLYVVGTEHPLKFFNGGRSVKSVMSRHPLLLARLQSKYGDQVQKVRDYYALKKHDVSICDVSPYIGRGQ